MNELVKACLDINRAGIDGDNQIYSTFFNQTLVSLGNYLLHAQHPEKSIRLRYGSKGPLKDVCIPLSGGMDSFCALHLAMQNQFSIKAVHVVHAASLAKERDIACDIYEATSGKLNFWSPHVQRSNSISFTVTQADIKSASSGLDWENYIIPARNLVIAAICAEYSDRIWLAAHKRSDETVGAADKTTKFFKMASRVFSEYYNRRIDVSSPFQSISKIEMVGNYLAAGGSLEAAAATWSCYTPKGSLEPLSGQCYSHYVEIPCGDCYACYKKYKLLQYFNFEYLFATHPPKSPNYDKYQEAEKKKGRS